MTGFLESVAGNLLGKIAEVASRSEIWPIQNELKRLEIIVSILEAVLLDAEKKQARVPELTPLLRQLEDAFSQAGDLIDELKCQYLKGRLKNRRNDGVKVRCFSSCSNFDAYTSKISEISETLDTIEKTMSRFHLIEKDNVQFKRLKSGMTLRTSITGSQIFGRLLHSKRETILSDNYEYSIVGREKERESIIDKLLTNGDNKDQFPVLSIHGIGGMGKTTLAKLVYDDDKVFDYFDKRMWVCVFEDFDVGRMRREILSCATGEPVTDVLTESQLQNRLQRNLIGRKFLLVLDDVGTLNSSGELEMKEILRMGANGSKIIVTTRREPILNDVGAEHKIERLDAKNSMDLFKQAFVNKNLPENLLEVAEEIVPKCDGVPLAIKCLSRQLSLETSDAEWVNVKDKSEIWKQEDQMKDVCVLPALRLSYDLLPSYLKPCFLCFSFLPKDYIFYSYELIQLWMAQGILHSDNNNPELVGEQYFNELWSRGLFEDVEEDALGYWFKIHSLVHDLAIQLSQKEQENLGSSHHLSFVGISNKDLPPSASSSIRSLTVPVGGVEPKINGVLLIKCISKFKQLRFLYLCNSSLEEIPTSIDTLKHLRYFDLRGNGKIKRLPESICNLQSLQTLILAFCSELEELPINIKNMIGLRLLWITTKQASLGKNGIGSLTSLRFLAIGGCGNLTQLFEDIDKLNSLQTLIIYDCKSLLTLPKGLNSLSGLCKMAIWGCEQLKFTFSLGMLCLKKLILNGFPALATLPQWINNLDLYLELLEIGDFPKLRTLPFWFANLWELRVLGITNCPRLADHMPDGMGNCSELKELRITSCGSLSQKCKDQSNHLQLEISHVPNIYVDSRRINKQQDSATVEHKPNGATNNGQFGVGPTEGVKHDGATNDGYAGVGPIEVVKHDGATDDSRAGVGPIEVVKHEGAADSSHVRIGPIEVVKHDGATGDGDAGAGQTEGVKHDGEIDSVCAGVGQIEQAKHDKTTDNKNANVEGTIGAKHDGATNNEHAGVGQIEQAKKNETTDNKNAKVEGTVGAKHDGATNDEHAGVGQTEGVKHGEATDGAHAAAGQTVIALEGF